MDPQDKLAFLGALAWFNHNSQKTLELFDDGSYATDHTATKILLHNGVTKEHLIELGVQALTRGCCTNYNARLMDPAKTGPVVCRNKIKSGWDQVDGIMPYSVQEENARPTSGPKWANNSCAVDCALMVAILINAGRVVADQQPQVELQRLSEPACILRRTVRMPWGNMNATQKTQLRDQLRQSLHAHDPTVFPLGGPLSIYDVSAVLLAGIPQITFTKATRLNCKHRKEPQFIMSSSQNTIRASEGLGLECSIGIEMDTDLPFTLEDLVQRTLGWHAQNNSPLLCQIRDPACKTAEKQTSVIDRLPPTLMLREGFWRADNANRNGPFERMTISYVTAAGRAKTTVYDPLGCILKGKNHFWLNWILHKDNEQRVVCYDGLQSGGMLCPVGDLCHSIEDGVKVMLVFYKQSMVDEHP